MDPFACAQRILEAVRQDDFYDACDYALNLVEWQRKGGFVGRAIADEVLQSIHVLDARDDTPPLSHQLYGLLDRFIASYHASNPHKGPIVDDFASIAAGLRKLNNERRMK